MTLTSLCASNNKLARLPNPNLKHSMQLHHHSPEQQRVLQGMANEIVADMLTVTFNKPEDDTRNIRYLAFRQGQLEVLKQLLADSYPDPQTDQELQAQAQQQAATNLGESQLNPF